MLLDRTAVVLNRSAGSGRAGGIWSSLRGRVPSHVSVLEAEGPVEARGRLLETLQSEARLERLLIVGGDGTINLVAESLERLRGQGRCGPTLPRLGVVPAGTGSDLAAALGLPSDPGVALDVALGERHREIDLMTVETPGVDLRVAVNVAAAGLAGRVDQLLAGGTGRKKRYLPTTLRALLGFKAVPARVVLDEGPSFEGAFYLVAIANGATFGRGMRIAPKARMDDGQLDLVLIADLPRWQLPWRLPQVLLGRHLNASWVTFRRGRRVHYEALGGPNLPIDLDGDPLDSSSATFSVRAGALIIAVP